MWLYYDAHFPMQTTAAAQFWSRSRIPLYLWDFAKILLNHLRGCVKGVASFSTATPQLAFEIQPGFQMVFKKMHRSTAATFNSQGRR